MTKAARFERYVRLSFYVNIALAPAMTFGLARANIGDAEAGLVAALNVVQTAVCLLLARAGVGHYLGERPAPRRLIAVCTATTLAGTATATVAGRFTSLGADGRLGTALAMVLSMAYIAALATAVRPRTSTPAAVLCCIAAGALGGGPLAALTLAVLLAAVLLGYRVTLWMLRIVRELDRARQVEAALAVAEERLRFARDLHDVVGRTLSVVALKAELAAQLAKRGRGEAVDEMLEVRRIAQDSLADLRAVVGGYRAADLAEELSGARALLSSAGIACHVTGGRALPLTDLASSAAVRTAAASPTAAALPTAAAPPTEAALPAEVQGVLGWVVREATTNLLRHSEARTCTIALETGARAVRLTMTNDGVPPGHSGSSTSAVRPGSGLTGLSERLAAVGGTMCAERVEPDGFRLTVEVPQQ